MLLVDSDLLPTSVASDDGAGTAMLDDAVDVTAVRAIHLTQVATRSRLQEWRTSLAPLLEGLTTLELSRNSMPGSVLRRRAGGIWLPLGGAMASSARIAAP